MRTRRVSAVAAWLVGGAAVASAGKKTAPVRSELDRYVAEAEARRQGEGFAASPGSLYSPGGPLADLGRDLRASQVDDIVTVVVFDRAVSLAKGTTQSQRQSNVNASVTAAAGPLKAGGPLPNLLSANSNQQLQGQGETTRENLLTATLTARVTRVLPNGFLVVEGTKVVTVNSEAQLVSVRGVVRPVDISTLNSVRSDQLAELEVKINGKGVVNDAIRRPNFLYRALLGLLPF